MKGKVVMVGLSLCVLGTVYFIVDSNRKGVDQIYLLPMDFQGCAVINYGVKEAPPLEIKNNEIHYKVQKDGIINTSSPMETGWVNKKYSGSHQLRAFYVNANGEKVKELSQEEIRFGATGSTQEEGEREKKYYYQIFGSGKTENQGCPAIGI